MKSFRAIFSIMRYFVTILSLFVRNTHFVRGYRISAEQYIPRRLAPPGDRSYTAASAVLLLLYYYNCYCATMLPDLLCKCRIVFGKQIYTVLIHADPFASGMLGQ